MTMVFGCSQESLKPLEINKPILAFGDSLTAGVGANKLDAYPEQLELLTGIEVINAGVSGETTEEGLKRLSTVLDQYNPQLVILLEGGNDILRGYDLQKTKLNLSAMITEIQARDIQLVLIGVPEKNIFSDSATIYEELAEEYELVFDRDTISSLIKKRQYKSDPIHFNSTGYKKLADKIHKILKKEGAL